ncbi:PREDICTED: tyrosine-protein kinase Btk29A-like isoform X2 [Priapulus caudatus]|uniref:Tyrosine-protein kinase n=1 Tax=Priapulus caudatus TaxID=37621 RepID=A0ABM1E4D4_PRICU|nr:PREDICTED: tyrosine-protein kinase Btk29A-like isoform X2 [Priapulus caudatus]
MVTMCRGMHHLSMVCRNNEVLSPTYHPGVFSSGKWSCCDKIARYDAGCETSTILSSKASPDMTNGRKESAMEKSLLGIPPIPRTKPPEQPSSSTSKKSVIALYNFKPIEGGDLALEKGEEYEILDYSRDHWWQAKNKYGHVGFIPSNYVEGKTASGLEQYEWYERDMTRQRAEELLRADGKEGCFAVRNSSTPGLYTLSVFSRSPNLLVRHYHIKKQPNGQYYLSEKHLFSTIPELIQYHKHNCGGLVTRLRNPPSGNLRVAPTTAGLSHDKWEIDPSELTLLDELGSGQFGVVRRGLFRGSIEVAIKMMKENTMSEDDFIEEAKVMTQLQHPNLVQLYGVSSKQRPIMIVTEFMKHGALLTYLRKNESRIVSQVALLLDMCVQVCSAMAYLEMNSFIHRDLAARNCLVGNDNAIKVADFGLARYVLDDEYTSSGGTKFPIKWAPPEVLGYARFSSKSDVWAFGILMWEVFTGGKMPYGRNTTNTQTVELVQRGFRLEKPGFCPPEVYKFMRNCWEQTPEQRPSFAKLKTLLERLQEDRDYH